MEAQMIGRIAIIGGVGFELAGCSKTIQTPFGNVDIASIDLLGDRDGEGAVFISRHGKNHLPPHKVNYRAIIYAARKSGATRAISINTVGTMSYHQVGSFFLPTDFVEFTKSRNNTFFEEEAQHVDMSQPYCPELAASLQASMQELGIVPQEGIYVCAEGPHLESPAQIRMMRQFGDVVGMTGYPEVVLAREIGLCYASLCIVTNEACGMNAGVRISLTDIANQVDQLSSLVKKILCIAAEKIPSDRRCSCGFDGSGFNDLSLKK
jgi:5'-methylthioadenosine phosphorylase